MKTLLKNETVFIKEEYKKYDDKITNIVANIEAEAIDSIYDFKNL